MVSPSTLRRHILQFAAIGLLVCPVWADELTDSLKAFEEKVSKAETQKDQARNYEGGGMRSTMQIKLLQQAIARGEYEKAEQLLQNVGGYGMPPELQEEWLNLVDQLGREITKHKDQALAKWRKEVDAVVTDAKKACLDAKTSADLDSILLKCAPLQMQRELQNTAAGQRSYRKLTGTAETLEAWANYLDFREANNTKQANTALRNLLDNQDFPLLTQEEISSRLLPETDQLDAEAALAQIFEGVESPTDIPKALERLDAITKNPTNTQLSGLNNEKNRLLSYQKAWELAEKGDNDAAVRSLERFSGGYASAQAYYDSFKEQITDRVLQAQVGQWTKLTKNENEDTAAFMDRILDELLTKGDYPTMIEVMKFASQTNREPERTSNLSSARRVIEQYMAAKRFEGAGDNLAAATNYRMVVAAPTNKYIPTKHAEEALKALQTKDPTAFKSYEGVLLEEIRSLRTQVQTLIGRSQSGRMYPPGYQPGPGY